MAPVAERPGWTIAPPIREGSETRVAIYHRQSAYGFWVWEADRESQLVAAVRGIDDVYAERERQLSAEIAQDDVNPQCRILT